MKSTTFIPAIVIAAIAVTATSAAAKGPRPTFEELDADGNGQVTQEEVAAHRLQKFTQADANGDGQLSVEEMQAAAQAKANARVTKMFEKHDANADGLLSEDELPKPRRASKMFERIDADGNGSISEQEYADAKDRMGRKHKRHQKPDADNN
ncbi:EF hand domain protein [Rhodobacteraceae bacterium KLH11]|nr:EF hand domain protein [Rhodobacteraceae bacterium KLH11]